MNTNMNFNCRKWTSEDKAKLQELYPHTKNIDLAKLFGRSETAVNAAAFKLGLKKSVSFMYECSSKSFFKKGDISWNKGVKGYMGPNVTSFKKGMTPANFVEVGTERLDADGYTYVKVENPNKWELKHRLVWKNLFGDIEHNHVVIFVDGNKTNFELSNLALVHRRELLYFNRWGKYSSEIMETQKLIFKIKNLIKNANKK